MLAKAVVVLPTYNERENLESIIQSIWRQADCLHILVVDDNSPDGTGEVAEQLKTLYPGRLSVLHRPCKQGLGKAYRDAFAHLVFQEYDIIIQMDADGSHDPSFLPAMLDQIEGSDLVIGSRYLGGIRVINWDFKRLVLSRLATKYVNLLTGMHYTDTTGGFKCWRRRTLAAIGLDNVFSTGYLFQIETTYRAHRKDFRIAEVPIIFYERQRGKSKIDWRIIVEAMLGVVRLSLFRPSRSADASYPLREA